MINLIDKMIIQILMKIATLLCSYSDKISSYELYHIKESIEELNTHISETKELKKDGDKR